MPAPLKSGTGLTASSPPFHKDHGRPSVLELSIKGLVPLVQTDSAPMCIPLRGCQGRHLQDTVPTTIDICMLVTVIQALDFTSPEPVYVRVRNMSLLLIVHVVPQHLRAGQGQEWLSPSSKDHTSCFDDDGCDDDSWAAARACCSAALCSRFCCICKAVS